MFSTVVSVLVACFVALAVLGHILVLQAIFHGRKGRAARNMELAAAKEVTKAPVASEEGKLAA